MPQAIVSEKGWVVIPKEIRDRLGLKKGSKVQIVEWGGVISIAPVLEDPIRAGGGMFKGGPSMTAALLHDRRIELELEEAEIEYGRRYHPEEEHKIADG